MQDLLLAYKGLSSFWRIEFLLEMAAIWPPLMILFRVFYLPNFFTKFLIIWAHSAWVVLPRGCFFALFKSICLKWKYFKSRSYLVSSPCFLRIILFFSGTYFDVKSSMPVSLMLYAFSYSSKSSMNSPHVTANQTSGQKKWAKINLGSNPVFGSSQWITVSYCTIIITVV